MAPAARADRAFTARFSRNANGDIAITGNTLETCSAGAAGCSDARKGGGSLLNNNNFVMERVDVDQDAATFDSSSARLELPDGARVLFAGLYYGARTDAGTRGKGAPDASPAASRTVDLKLPGDSGYTRLGDSGSTLDQSAEVKGAYQVFHDVTDLVRRAGAGEYTIANVQSATGEDRYAGWALVVAYEAAGEPPRNLTVFDGLQSVTTGKPAVTIPVSGFQTPLGGPVRTRLGFVAYEGDLGSAGDSAALDGQAVADAVNPAKNFFDSGVSVDGSPFTRKSPDYRNQLGFDAKLVRADGLLRNGATSADIALKTASEQYFPGAITFATDLYAPDVHAVKHVENLTHPDRPAQAGDRLRYTIEYRNTGLEAAQNFTAQDDLPRGISFIPGSLRIADLAAPAGDPTDLAGDDLGEYDPAGRTVKFFLGAGASPGQGGTVAAGGQPGSTVAVGFEAEVDPGIQSAHEISNTAGASLLAGTLGTTLSAISNPAPIAVQPSEHPPPEADLAVKETETDAAMTGAGEIQDAVTVRDLGPDEATDVVIDITPPPGAVIAEATTDAGTCEVGPGRVTCRLAPLDDGGSAQIDLVEMVPVQDEMAGAMNEVTASAAELDPKPGDNDAAATAPPEPVLPAADAANLQTTVSADRSSVLLGGTVTDTITVHDAGPGPAVGVDVTGALSLPAAVVAIHAPGGDCRQSLPLRCRLPDLAAGASANVSLVLRPLRAGRLIDTVSASSDRVDDRPGDDLGEVTTLVRRAHTQVRLGVHLNTHQARGGARIPGFVELTNQTSVPAVAATVCTRLGLPLELVSAPGAARRGGRLCWSVPTLGAHASRRLPFVVALSPTAGPGRRLTVPANVTGDDFAPRRGLVRITVAGNVNACASSATVGLARARIAC